jgi:hypothetical protein
MSRDRVFALQLNGSKLVGYARLIGKDGNVRWLAQVRNRKEGKGRQKKGRCFVRCRLPLSVESDHFVKTGSGQTSEEET